MNKQLQRVGISIALAIYIIIAATTVYNTQNKIQLKEVKLKNTSAQLKELQLKYNLLNGDLDAQLKAKQADQQKIDELEKQRQQLEQQLSVKKAQEASNKALSALSGSNVAIAASADHNALMEAAGIPQDQWACTEYIISHESGWRVNASNASSGAYGLPQSLPGSKMASAGADWQTNPVTQLKWYYGYTTARYGSPCGAYEFWTIHRWY